jgi:hypothetical protein
MINEKSAADVKNSKVPQIQIAIESFVEHHVWASNEVERLGHRDELEDVKARNQS